MKHNYGNLQVWKRGCRLAVDVYTAIKDSREFAYRDQLIRSSLSIPSNLAEGSERGTTKDFIRFVYIAIGSAAELRTQILIAQQAQILPADTAKPLAQEAVEIAAMLRALIKSLEEPEST